MKEIISTSNAPAAIGAYSQAIKINDFLYVSGQIPLLPETGNVVANDFKSQAEQVFKNILAIIKAADAKEENIIKLSAYLTDLNNFAEFNETMEKYISKPFPARAAVGVAALPKGVLVEAEVIVYVGE